jgi:hypothetical protein
MDQTEKRIDTFLQVGNDIISNESNLRSKFLQLEKLKRQGHQLSKTYDMSCSIEEMEFELHVHRMNKKREQEEKKRQDDDAKISQFLQSEKSRKEKEKTEKEQRIQSEICMYMCLNKKHFPPELAKRIILLTRPRQKLVIEPYSFLDSFFDTALENPETVRGMVTLLKNIVSFSGRGRNEII